MGEGVKTIIKRHFANAHMRQMDIIRCSPPRAAPAHRTLKADRGLVMVHSMRLGSLHDRDGAGDAAACSRSSMHGAFKQFATIRKHDRSAGIAALAGCSTFNDLTHQRKTVQMRLRCGTPTRHTQSARRRQQQHSAQGNAGRVQTKVQADAVRFSCSLDAEDCAPMFAFIV